MRQNFLKKKLQKFEIEYGERLFFLDLLFSEKDRYIFESINLFLIELKLRNIRLATTFSTNDTQGALKRLWYANIKKMDQ